MFILPPLDESELARFRRPDLSLHKPVVGGLAIEVRQPTDPGFDSFVEHLDIHGFKPRSLRNTTCDVMVINGPVEEHTDNNGLTAICLIRSSLPIQYSDWISSHPRSEYSQEAQLITHSRTASLNRGDIVVFDSNRPHAWLSGFKCIVASIFVSRIRTPR